MIWPTVAANEESEVVEINNRSMRLQPQSGGKSQRCILNRAAGTLIPQCEVGEVVQAKQIVASVVSIHLSPKPVKIIDEDYFMTELKSASLSDRYAAAKALGFRGYEKAGDSLQTRMQDGAEDIYVRLEAASALAAHGSETGWAFLSACIDSEFLAVQLETVIVLSEIQQPESERLLINVLSDAARDSEVRAGAAWALGEFASEQSAIALTETFDLTTTEIKIEAARALLKITPSQLENIVGILKSTEQSKRDGLAWALARAGGFDPKDLVGSEIDDNLRRWVSYIFGYGKELFVEGQIDELAKIDPEVHFAASVLWQILASWVHDLEEYWRMLRESDPLYRTRFGEAVVGDALQLLPAIPDSSIDLVITSPPFALRRKKTYGNVEESEYVDWLKPFGKEVLRTLKDSGSFVLDLGGSYRQGVPSRSLYNFRVLLSLCDDLGFHLAEDFYWFNPSKLPSPIEWVNKRKIRAKDSVNTIWWLSKTEWPKADVRNVLQPYSERMKKLISNPEDFYTPKKRPSGHDIGARFGKDNGGAIPSNLISAPNTDSNSAYIRLCKEFDLQVHPARFPEEIPRFFIRMLTEPGDRVLDIFAGSNTTGAVAESLERRWLALEASHEYLITSAFRFLENPDLATRQELVEKLANKTANFRIPDTRPLLSASA